MTNLPGFIIKKTRYNAGLFYTVTLANIFKSVIIYSKGVIYGKY